MEHLSEVEWNLIHQSTPDTKKQIKGKLICVLALAGVRVNDFRSLMVDNINLPLSIIFMQDGRMLPLNKDALEAVKAWLAIRVQKGNARVLVSSLHDGSHVRYDNLEKLSKLWMRKAIKRELSISNLNRIFLKRLIDKGIKQRVAADIAGYTRPVATHVKKGRK